MLGGLSNPCNPNPITKLCVTFLMGFTALNQINIYFEWGIVLIIAFLFYKNGFGKDAMKSIIFFGLLSFLLSFKMLEETNPGVKMLFILVIVVRIFYLPFLAGKFLIKTSDVGSIISSMDKIKFSRNISIPVAVMFRFFPSFKEEKQNIKLAMKIRGINPKNPFLYIKYVAVPLLVISSNIADDIARAAETRAIENPIKKTRYIDIKLKPVDFVYALLTVAIVIGGWHI